MILNRIRKAIQISIFAAGAALGSGAAHAIAYTGSWDPLFGQAISGLGWQGTATFDVPTPCVISSGTVTLAGCAGMTLVSATVGLYTTNPLNPFATLNFGSSSSPFLSEVQFSGGALTGVTGGFLLPANVNLGATFPTLAYGENTHFWLAFTGGPEMFFVTCKKPGALTTLKSGTSSAKTTFPTGASGVTGWVNSNFIGDDEDGSQCGNVEASGWNDNGSGTGPGPLGWTGGQLFGPNDSKVPEPASLVLVLSALGAGWVARRRRS